MFNICIEQDKCDDINNIFGLMIGDLVKELEAWKEVALFADLDLIMTTGHAGTSGGPFIRPVIPLVHHYTSETGRVNI
jgi:hypothetical protein